MTTDVTQQIFGCKLLNTREKWMVIRYIKQHNLSEEKIEEILNTLRKEDQFKQEAKLESLKNWNDMLSKLIHEKVNQKISAEGKNEDKEDDKEADKLLSDFLNDQ